MEKSFDIKHMIMNLEDHEWKIKKLEQAFKEKHKIEDNDPILEEKNPERTITIRKKKHWKNVRKSVTLTSTLKKSTKHKMIEPE